MINDSFWVDQQNNLPDNSSKSLITSLINIQRKLFTLVGQVRKANGHTQEVGVFVILEVFQHDLEEMVTQILIVKRCLESHLHHIGFLNVN